MTAHKRPDETDWHDIVTVVGFSLIVFAELFRRGYKWRVTV